MVDTGLGAFDEFLEDLLLTGVGVPGPLKLDQVVVGCILSRDCGGVSVLAKIRVLRLGSRVCSNISIGKVGLRSIFLCLPSSLNNSPRHISSLKHVSGTKFTLRVLPATDIKPHNVEP